MKKGYLKFVYRLWSCIYDNYIDRAFSFDRSIIIKQLNVKKGDKILEVGVGTGLNLPYYPKECVVHGIDFSREMLAKAKKKKPKAKWVLKKMDAQKMSFGKNVFDKALATYVLRLAPNPNMIMKEVERVTKPGARFVILDQFKEGDKFLLSLFQPLKLVLGWGKEYHINELTEGTNWKLIQSKRMGKMKGTRVCILKNMK